MSRRLLVVDDALIIREMIKDFALSDGWEIAGEAANGDEAIKQYKALSPDVVTLDLVMPEFDGIHGLEGIMKHDGNAKVLVVSALDQSDVLKRAIKIGAYDFVVKPFNESKILSALRKIYTPDLLPS